MSNPGNIIGGHKANLNNPNTSDESKQHSKDVLNQEFDGGNIEHHSNQNKNPGNVYVFISILGYRRMDANACLLTSTGGLKATLNNPNVSDEAKQSAKDRLNDM